MTLHDRATIRSATGRNDRSRRSATSWRKILLQNRAALLRVWPRYFPQHDFATLRPNQSIAKLLPPPGWDDHWAEAARAYRDECEKSLGDVARNVVRQSWPTPQSTVEAVMLSVHERGLAALEEPDTLERLSRCDASAHEKINRRITALKG